MSIYLLWIFKKYWFILFNAKNVNNINDVLYGCKSLVNLNISNFDIEQVIDIGCMFRYRELLKNIDLSHFNTKNVNNMNGMFYGWKCLVDLNISNFKTQ